MSKLMVDVYLEFIHYQEKFCLQDFHKLKNSTQIIFEQIKQEPTVHLLGHNIVDLSADEANILVNLGLVLFIDFGKGEESHHSQDDQRQAVEPRPQVCQAPQQAAKLEHKQTLLKYTYVQTLVNSKTNTTHHNSIVMCHCFMSFQQTV